MHSLRTKIPSALRICPAPLALHLLLFDFSDATNIRSKPILHILVSEMPRYKDEPVAVRVYTVCDESKYLIVRNVPSLGCGEELKRLFESYGPVEECKPMDAEDCEPYTDVFFIKFSQVSNARFSKRKLDESVFLGNRIQVTYAPQFETLSDTKEKLEVRRREVLSRIYSTSARKESTQAQNSLSHKRGHGHASQGSSTTDMVYDHVSSNKDYFPSASMNATVNLVRHKLDKIESRSKGSDSSMASKKPKVDARRRI
ncbi:RNA-binding protein 48 [Rhynchospora pubera]|uniref:RNA-binding protein 48 n=1 Tax=Rhynchospora pubera TaxID=906938 RepID=A0AAV8GGK3_9POAL|nr:RNA-binding protein 48 [Rhynchospora pubera]